MKSDSDSYPASQNGEPGDLCFSEMPAGMSGAAVNPVMMRKEAIWN